MKARPVARYHAASWAAESTGGPIIGTVTEVSAEAGAVEDERGGGQARGADGLLEQVVEEVLDALVDRAEPGAERPVLLAADGEEVPCEGGQVVFTLQGNAGLADFAQFQVEIGEKTRVGGIEARCLVSRWHGG